MQIVLDKMRVKKVTSACNAITVLESCVKACGDPVHNIVGKVRLTATHTRWFLSAPSPLVPPSLSRAPPPLARLRRVLSIDVAQPHPHV